jgi:hypothetical protein
MRRQDDLVDYFVNGGTHGEASNMYIEGNTLYSYGLHFPLLVRMEHWKQGQFLMNADKHSVTTSQHQGMCFRHATVMLSFRMLNLANIDYQKLNLIDTREAYSEFTGFYRYSEKTGKRLSDLQYHVRTVNFGRKARHTSTNWMRPSRSIVRRSKSAGHK